MKLTKKYLKQSAGIDISNLPEWNFINTLRKIRNKMVHHESLIELSHPDYHTLHNFSLNNFTLKSHSEEEYEIVLDKKEFIDFILKKLEDFLVVIEYN